MPGPRPATKSPGSDAQIAILNATVIDGERVGKIFQEQVSSVDAKRDKLEEMIEFAREGDTVVCTKLDRLARSVAGMVEIAERLKRKGASILILDPRLSNRTAAEELTFNLLSSIAQFERQIMLERQREGIRKAHTEGKFKGRVPTVRRHSDRILELRGKGRSAREIVEELNGKRDERGKLIKMTERSVYRVLSDAAKVAA